MNNYSHSVRVKNGAGWRQFERIRLLISVGKEYHEGSKLQAVVDWINRNPGIRGIHISVNDNLQRHNFMADGMTEEQASRIALAEGALWLARNGDVLHSIRSKQYITRWNDWFTRKEFPEIYKAIQRYAETDAAFEDAIRTDSIALARRKEERGEDVPSLFVKHSRNYVTEELAVFLIQSTEWPAAEVYPGSNLASAQYLLGKQLPEKIQVLANRYFTRIDFSRINTSFESMVGSNAG